MKMQENIIESFIGKWLFRIVIVALIYSIYLNVRKMITGYISKEDKERDIVFWEAMKQLDQQRQIKETEKKQQKACEFSQIQAEYGLPIF